jgi:hypothetical protein
MTISTPIRGETRDVQDQHPELVKNLAEKYRQTVEAGGRVRFGQRADLRLVARGRLAELYVNDYLVDDYDISGCSGEITVLSSEPVSLRAWQPDPA